VKENTLEHTRLLRLGLAEPECREYWSHAEGVASPDERVRLAFEQRWFGSRAMARVRYLVTSFVDRFDAYPSALETLHGWPAMEPGERRVVCHWHLQLSDPLYRKFTSSHLIERLNHPAPTLDRNATLRWLEGHANGRWAASTTQRMAAGLSGCLNEVGYTSGTASIRPITLPNVSDRTLGYLLYLLKEIHFDGQFGDNPYLRSLGLVGDELHHRLRSAAGVRFQKLANVTELEWHYPDLRSWARGELQ
jgi:hypothetical protein